MISKLSCDDLPLGRFGSMPEWEQGELDLPCAPHPLTDLPVLFEFMSTTRLCLTEPACVYSRPVSPSVRFELRYMSEFVTVSIARLLFFKLTALS